MYTQIYTEEIYYIVVNYICLLILIYMFIVINIMVIIVMY